MIEPKDSKRVVSAGLTSQINVLKERYEELVEMRKAQEVELTKLKEEIEKFSSKTTDDISNIQSRLDIIES